MDTEKSEITNLPEGMSSEELDNFTTGEDAEQTGDSELAQEALDATELEESSPAEESVETDDETKPAEEKTSEPEEKKPDVDPKDAVIGGMRREAREAKERAHAAELKSARLEGELEARKSVQAKTETPVEKSPLEIAEAAYIEENGDLEGFAMNGELYRKQRAFDKTADEKVATTDKHQQVNASAIQAETDLQEGDLSTGKMGQGLDLQTVAGIGTAYLTKGDRLDIADMVQTRGSKTALKEAYRIMVRRTLAADNEDSKLLQNAINTSKKKVTKTQTKPNKEQGKPDIDALTTEGEDADTGEAETDTHSNRLTNFIFGPD